VVREAVRCGRRDGELLVGAVVASEDGDASGEADANLLCRGEYGARVDAAAQDETAIARQAASSNVANRGAELSAESCRSGGQRCPLAPLDQAHEEERQHPAD